MKRLAFFLLVVCAGSAAAEEGWEPLTGAQIQDALTDRRVTYAAAWQEFRASGRTLYNAGQDSWGYWRVEGDMYCSLWPPSDLWACYAVARRGDVLRFVGDRGDISEGTYAD